VTYGDGGDSMARLYTLLTPQGTRLTRPLKLLAEAVRKPRQFLRTLVPGDWSRRTLILLVMQTLDNSIRLRPVEKRLGRGRPSADRAGSRQPQPDLHPCRQRRGPAAGRQDRRPTAELDLRGAGQHPSTAHILGGAVIGRDEQTGVVDGDGRVFGYERMLVTDGAAIPANPGVNPSLTITALAERTLSKVPPKTAAAAVEGVRMTWEVPRPQTSVVPGERTR
jgi:cholesterol oxidase